jgi:hypothetical protein
MLQVIRSMFHSDEKLHRCLTLDSAGLAPTGASDGDCSSNTGQVYVRGATYGSYYALMYSWYGPPLPSPQHLSNAPKVHAQRRALHWARPPPRLGRRDRLALLLHRYNRRQHPSSLPLRSRKLGLHYLLLTLRNGSSDSV